MIIALLVGREEGVGWERGAGIGVGWVGVGWSERLNRTVVGISDSQAIEKY